MTDAITNIHQVTPWSFDLFLPRLPHLHLEGIARDLAKISYFDFVKETRTASKVFETLLQASPHF
ncbi:MAG: hypothetical protein OXF67_04745, partial [Cyanobacteria bacterium MAG CAR4_bin_6]|nr:hypothetical protein [Cyanobacteria bacterium MAG CAR4_bin_6]